MRIIQAPPDPGIQSFLDYVSRLQEERWRREQERMQERTFDVASFLGGGIVSAFPTRAEKKEDPWRRAGTAALRSVSLALPFVGGAVAGPAGMQAGAAIGGQIRQQFGDGGTVGGDTMMTAAKAAAGIMQTMEDRKLYGYVPTGQEKKDLGQLALKYGTTLGQLAQVAKVSGGTIPEALQIAEMVQADDARLQDILTDYGYTGSTAQFKEEAAAYPGGEVGLGLDMQKVAGEQKIQMAGQKAFAKDMSQTEAMMQAAARNEQMELHYDQREIAIYGQKMQDIQNAVATGNLTAEQGIQQRQALRIPQASWRPRQTPQTIEENESISQKTSWIYRRDPRSPSGFTPVGRMGEEAEAKQMTEVQWAKAMNDEIQALYDPAKIGIGKKIPQAEKEKAAYESLMRKKAMRDRYYAPPPPPLDVRIQQRMQTERALRQPQAPAGPPALQAPQAVAPAQTPSQLERDAGLLVQMSTTAKPEHWTPAQKRTALEVATRFQIELIDTYGEAENVPPELLPALRFALRILKGE